MGWLIPAIIVGVLLIALCVHETKKARRKREQHIDSQELWLSSNDVKKDVDYLFDIPYSSPDMYARYIADTDKCNIYLSTNRKSFVALPFDQINGVEIMEDSDVVGGIGRAVAGGIIAGGLGALVGAATAKKHIMSYKLILYTKDISNPHITIHLIKGQTPKNDGKYQLASEFANNVNASIKAILANQTERSAV